MSGTAGNIVYRRGFDTRDSGDNDRQSFVAVLSLGPVAAIESFSVDRASVTFNGSGQAVGAYSGFMWQTTQLGALSGPALGFGTGAGTPPGWSASHRLSGKAAATWTLRFDTKAKLFQNGVPAPMWKVRGIAAWDPRKDSTYPGGSGPHRMADPADTVAYDAAIATWEWTENPYLLGLRFVHGIWQRDVANSASKWQRVMGMGAPQSGIDLAAFVEGANVAQANGWAAGGVIFSGDDKWQSLKKILQAGMGEPLALGAKIGCLVNAPKVSLATIGIDDVVGDASVGATQPRRSRVNTITPRYRLEANNWQLLPGSPITVADYVTIDRGRRSRVQDYPFIQNSSQVGTAVRYDIENAREFGPIVLPLKLFWMGYKPGDCVTATLPELGLNAQPILLLNRSLDPSAGVVTITARSETPGKHPFALGQTATPPPTPGVTGAPIVPTPGETAWAISGTKMTSGAVAVPALIVTGAVDAGSPDAVVFEYRPFSSGQAADVGWVAAGIEPPTTTRKEIVSVTGGTPYEVAVSYRARGVQSARRILGPVTTDDFSGSGGAPGLNNATVTIYQRSASGAPALPSAVATYTFATATLSGLNNSWSTSIPAGSDPIYASAATASSTGATDTIAANEWATARQIASNGANGTSGLNNKSLFIYQRLASTPALPSQNAIYTFSTAITAGLNNGWAATIPAANGLPLWVSTATALSPTDVDNINPSEWATAQKLAEDGTDGAGAWSIPAAYMTKFAIDGGRLTKIVGGGFETVISAEQFPQARVSAVVASVTTNTQIGLINPDGFYWALYVRGDVNPPQLLANFGESFTNLGTPAVGDRIEVAHVGDQVQLRRNGALLPLNGGATAGTALSLWGAMLQQGAYLDNVTFSRSGSAGADAYLTSLSLTTVTIDADYNGVSKPQQFPRTVKVTVKKGGADVTGQVAFTRTNSNASIASSLAQDGTLTITQADATGYIEIGSTHAGVTLAAVRVAIERKRDTTPPGTATQQPAPFALAIDSTTYVTRTNTPVVTVTTSGVLRGRLTADYRVDVPDQNSQFTFIAAGKLMYRPAGSGAPWSDMGAEQAGTAAVYRPLDGSEPGTLSVDRSVNVAAGNYEVMGSLRKSSGTGTSATTTNGYTVGGQ